MLKDEMKNILGWQQNDLSNLQFVAYNYIKQGKYDVAQTILEALEVLDPTDSYTLQTLGAVYIENKNPYGALNVLEKALQLDPLHELSQFNRIQALISLGLKKQALIDCEKMVNAKNPMLKAKAEAILLSEQIF
jgi:tetratricopeptide (TPR) repeat protein